MAAMSKSPLISRLNFGRGLGPLETRIMEVAWDGGPQTVREVLNALAAQGQTEHAYTTVMTVMGNLVEKGLLRVEPQGRSYLYSPTVSRAEYVRSHVKQALDTLLDSFTEPTLSYLAERLGAADAEQLDALERRLRDAKAQADEEGDTA
jgi:predicted transcriptional regulator